MIEEWQNVELGEYVDLTAGYAFESDEFTENTDDVPLVKGSNVQQGYIEWEESKYWPREKADEFGRFLLEEGDVVVAMDRPWVEAGLKWAWIRQGDPTALLVQRIARLRSQEGLNQEFLRYLIGSQQFTNYIRPIVTGVNVPHISGDQIESFTFSLPPIEYQHKAATILSRYDDLIQNDLERIDLLEEITQLLYREWFVRFQFPGYENSKMMDSPIGEIPEGWEVKKLEEVCELILGMSPKSEYYNENGEGLPFHQGVSDFGDRFPETQRYCTVDKRVAEPGDILFSVRAPVGRINVADRRIIVGRGLCAIRHQSGRQWFLLHQLKNRFHEEDIMGGGTIYNSVTKKDMLNLELLCPPESHLKQFSSLVVVQT